MRVAASGRTRARLAYIARTTALFAAADILLGTMLNVTVAKALATDTLIAITYLVGARIHA